MGIRRSAWVVLSVGFAAAALRVLQAAPQDSPSSRTAAPMPAASANVRAALNQYCVACHNQRAKTGGLALDAISLENPAENGDVWEKVVRKLRSGAMPPLG